MQVNTKKLKINYTTLLKSSKHIITKTMMFSGQSRPHFLLRLREPARNLAKKETSHSFPKTLCVLRHITKSK